MPDPFTRAGAGPDLDDVGPVFIASFTTECPGCGGDVEPGDEARMVDGQAHHDDEDCLP